MTNAEFVKKLAQLHAEHPDLPIVVWDAQLPAIEKAFAEPLLRVVDVSLDAYYRDTNGEDIVFWSDRMKGFVLSSVLGLSDEQITALEWTEAIVIQIDSFN